MSLNAPPSPRSPYAEHRAAPATGRASGRAAWARLAAVAAILAASGGARLWQERRVDRALERGRSSPFPLAALPMTIGSWEGREASLDPQVVRITGSTDLATRRYVDRRTGVGLDVVILYGPGFDLAAHTPEACYPSAGYEAMPGAFDRSIPLGPGGAGGASARFRSLAYTRGDGGLADSQEVYYSLRYDGRWAVEGPPSRALRRLPGLFKIQVARRISSRERRDVDNPCEPFLAALVGAIEARIAARPPDPSNTPD